MGQHGALAPRPTSVTAKNPASTTDAGTKLSPRSITSAALLSARYGIAVVFDLINGMVRSKT